MDFSKAAYDVSHLFIRWVKEVDLILPAGYVYSSNHHTSITPPSILPLLARKMPLQGAYYRRFSLQIYSPTLLLSSKLHRSNRKPVRRYWELFSPIFTVKFHQISYIRLATRSRRRDFITLLPYLLPTMMRCFVSTID
jgi:hypothetical protein